MFNLPNTMLTDRKVKRKYRLHVLGFVHIPCSTKYYACAFTQKMHKFCEMMMSLGHEVYLYASEGSTAPCTEHIVTHTLKDIRNAWGDKGVDPKKFELGYDWRKEVAYRYEPDTDTRKKLVAQLMVNQIAGVQSRAKSDDFLVLSMGDFHKEVKDVLGMMMTVETGVAYRGTCARFRAFESEYMRNFVGGLKGVGKDTPNGAFYDRTIPNYFRESEFPIEAIKTNKADRVDKNGKPFILYVGRFIPRKGINIVAKVATAARHQYKLYMAGQGKIDTKSKNVEILGVLNPEERSWWMSRATAVLVPTLYLEPFGGVAVEAMLSGTPILTTNFGVFPEYNVNGVTGYRCDMFRDFTKALSLVDDLDRTVIRKHAERYLMNNMRWEYQKWFDDIYDLYLSVATKDKKIIKNAWFTK